MKIVVAIKQAPASDSPLRVNAAGTWIEESDLSYQINEPDAYALEEGLQLKEKMGGELVVLCAGPARAAQTLREALAKGADRAIHVEADELSHADALQTARLMARALRPEQPTVVLTGLQSDDLGHGQTGVILAELLDLPHATIVMSVEPHAGSLMVKRELEGGWFQKIELPLPALLTIQSGSTRLRYATLMGIKKAKSKEIKRIPANELGGAGAPLVSVDRAYLPEKAKRSQILEGSPQEAAAKLVQKLRFEARVL